MFRPKFSRAGACSLEFERLLPALRAIQSALWEPQFLGNPRVHRGLLLAIPVCRGPIAV